MHNINKIFKYFNILKYQILCWTFEMHSFPYDQNFKELEEIKKNTKNSYTKL